MTGTHRLAVGMTVALALLFGVRGAAAQCRGDFNGDEAVTIDELVTAVENALDGCVVGSERFVDNDDGTITDRRTGLMWEKKIALDGTVDAAGLHDADNTYVWSGECSPGSEEIFCQPTAAAIAACPAGATGCGACPDEQVCNRGQPGRPTVFEWVAELNGTAFAGHSDWRVPTLAELESLVDRGRADPAIDPAWSGTGCAGTCTDLGDPACSCTRLALYWTATPTVTDRPRAWSVRFDIGAIDAGGLFFDVAARAVRSAP